MSVVAEIVAGRRRVQGRLDHVLAINQSSTTTAIDCAQYFVQSLCILNLKFVLELGELAELN